jgi:hypothetical protein
VDTGIVGRVQGTCGGLGQNAAGGTSAGFAVTARKRARRCQVWLSWPVYNSAISVSAYAPMHLPMIRMVEDVHGTAGKLCARRPGLAQDAALHGGTERHPSAAKAKALSLQTMDEG